MAKFEVDLPDNIIKDIREIDSKADEIFGSMTKAGAEVVRNAMVSKAPPSIQPHIKTSVTYKTPSDGGINNKVYISGYIPFKGGRTTFSRSGNGGRYTTTKGVPADFLAKVFEYGRSGRPFPKKPFFRKSFKKSAIEAAMRAAQSKASGGLLDE